MILGREGTLEKEIGNPLQYSYHLLKSIAIRMAVHEHKSTLASSNLCQEGSHCKISSERNMGVVSTLNLCNKFFFNAS